MTVKVNELHRLIMSHALEHGTAEIVEVAAEVNKWPISGDRHSSQRLSRKQIGELEYRRGYVRVHNAFKGLRQKGLLKVDGSLTLKGFDLAKELGLGQNN